MTIPISVYASLILILFLKSSNNNILKIPPGDPPISIIIKALNNNLHFL
jgi:hypothetical protein